MVLPLREKTLDNNTPQEGVSFHPNTMGQPTGSKLVHKATPHPKKKQRLERAEYDEIASLNYGGDAESETSYQKEEGDPTEVSETPIQTEQPDIVDENVKDNDVAEETEEQPNEPDWNEMSTYEPARTNIPRFLSARERRFESDKRFGAALDEFSEAMDRAKEGMLQIAVEKYYDQKSKMDELELSFEQTVVSNHDTRVAMEERLKQSAQQAQGFFAQLLMRVTQPFAGQQQEGEENDAPHDS